MQAKRHRVGSMTLRDMFTRRSRRNSYNVEEEEDQQTEAMSEATKMEQPRAIRRSTGHTNGNAMDAQFLDIFRNSTVSLPQPPRPASGKSEKHYSENFQTSKRSRNFTKDSLDELDFDRQQEVNKMTHRYPMLCSLWPHDIKQFKIELEVSEETRAQLNRARESHRQIARPQPKALVHRKLWGAILIEFREINPKIRHFIDATFEDLETWLIRALVPRPNNRPFLKRLEYDLKRAWADSYFFGVPRSLLCIPGGGGEQERYRMDAGLAEDEAILWEEEFGHDSDLIEMEKSKSVNLKKISTTSSISLQSMHDIEEEDEDDGDEMELEDDIEKESAREEEPGEERESPYWPTGNSGHEEEEEKESM